MRGKAGGSPTYSAAQVRAAEKPLLAAGEPLMARAAAALARIAMEALAECSHRPRILVLVGSGNNGGDALFAAAQLTGVADVDVLLTSSSCHERGLDAALAAGARRLEPPETLGTVAEAHSVSKLEAVSAMRPYDMVLDGILGIGAAADPALRGTAREAVDALLPDVRAGRSRVIAVDLPSGLHPDTGAADEAVLSATLTVTFGAVKHGLITGRGPELVGEIVLVPIGLEEQLAAVTQIGRAPLVRVLGS